MNTKLVRLTYHKLAVVSVPYYEWCLLLTSSDASKSLRLELETVCCVPCQHTEYVRVYRAPRTYTLSFGHFYSVYVTHIHRARTGTVQFGVASGSPTEISSRTSIECFRQ